MSFNLRASSMALVLASVGLVGCAADGSNNFFTTGALGPTQTAAAAPAPEPRVDPACVSLASRIEMLRKEGIADKIEKAATKKYKMTNADLAKADQLTKVSAEFQLRCSTITPNITAQSAPMPPPPAAKAPAPAAKATPKATPKAASSAAVPTNTQN